jgi:hypothetical protein
MHPGTVEVGSGFAECEEDHTLRRVSYCKSPGRRLLNPKGERRDEQEPQKSEECAPEGRPDHEKERRAAGRRAE